MASEGSILLSVGFKNNSNDCIESKFVTELKDLLSGINNQLFCKALGWYIHVHFKILASLSDQPERREMNYMMNDNTIFGARCSYAAGISSFRSSLVSCNKCEEGIKSNPEFLLNKK